MGKVLYVRREQHRSVAAGAGAVDQRQAAGAASTGCRMRSACSIRGAEREMFRSAPTSASGFTAFSPLAGGWLTGKYRAAERIRKRPG